MSKSKVMLDLETLGRKPGAAILSIGAVRFDRDGLGEELHWSVSLDSCQTHGLTIDAATLEWWLGRDDDAQQVLRGGVSLPNALEKFRVFADECDEIWARSPAFDCVLLGAAYNATGVSQPWRYHEQRDCRTLAELPAWPDDLHQDGAKHNALADAKYQARCTSRALQQLHAGDSDA